MWCSNHLVLSCSLQTMAGSEPRQSRPHYQKKLGSLNALIASNAMSLHQTGINFASNLCKSPYW
ncbi:hypothetical protein F2Q68_00040840 [Brassica cretica]|uniref:Uncharacterized protein n=1 Tax=Brassica cretica TaxID=69181 RepID=A0A8S9MR62_BRACR|nr:hypothetical protein F2Q68_00040840 [Brassica cretica]